MSTVPPSFVPPLASGRVRSLPAPLRYTDVLTLDAAAYADQFVRDLQGNIWEAVNGEWRPLTAQLPAAPNTVTVGPGGEYAELDDALAFFATKIAPNSDDPVEFGGAVRILTGYVPARPVILLGLNLSWVFIYSDDAQIDVPVSACSIFRPAGVLPEGRAFFSGLLAGMPRLNCLFRLDNATWTGPDSDLTAGGILVYGVRAISCTGMWQLTPAQIHQGGFTNFSIGALFQNSSFALSRMRISDNRAANLQNFTSRLSISDHDGRGAFGIGIQTTQSGTTMISGTSNFRKTVGNDNGLDILDNGGLTWIGTGVLGGTNIYGSPEVGGGRVMDSRRTDPVTLRGRINPSDYTTATRPSAATAEGDLITVTDDPVAGRAALQYVAGAAWRTILDRDMLTALGWTSNQIYLRGPTALVGIGVGAFQTNALVGEATGFTAARWANDNAAVSQNFGKSRGATVGNYATVQANDLLGALRFLGTDGTQFQQAAIIQVSAVGTISAGIVPGNIDFRTADAAGVMVTGLRITQTQTVGIGVNTPTCPLQVNGPIRCASYTVATVPSASGSGAGAQIYVSNETGGAVLAFSDAVNWRRVTDRVIIS